MRVACFYDRAGWAWWNKSQLIKRHMPSDILVDVLHYQEQFDPAKYDLFVLFDAYLGRQIRQLPRSRTLIGCSNLRLLENTLSLAERYQSPAVFVNNQECFELASRSSSRKVYCCQNGVDLELFRPTRAPDQKPFVACWVGNSLGVANKGVEIIREACRRTAVPLLALDANANNHEQSELWSHEAIRDGIYGQAAFFICASEFEGTPNPALEAMACGLPVISTRVGNMPEVIEHGRNGYLIERSVDSLVEAILELSNSSWPLMGLQAQESISQGWSWAEQSKKYELMFREQYARLREQCKPRPIGISVILSDSGSGEALERCLQSFERQDLDAQSFEVILISQNQSLENEIILNSFKSILNIRALVSPESSLGSLRNEAIRVSKAEKILTFDTNFSPASDLVRVACQSMFSKDQVAVFTLLPSEDALESSPLLPWFDHTFSPFTITPDKAELNTLAGVYLASRELLAESKFDEGEEEVDLIDIDFFRKLVARGECRFLLNEASNSVLTQTPHPAELLGTVFRNGQIFGVVSGQADGGVQSLKKELVGVINDISEGDISRALDKLKADYRQLSSSSQKSLEDSSSDIRSIATLLIEYFFSLGYSTIMAPDSTSESEKLLLQLVDISEAEKPKASSSFRASRSEATDADYRSDPEYWFKFWYEQICDPQVLKHAKETPLFWLHKDLEWDAKHEIFLCHSFYGNKYKVDELLALSNNRYEILGELWRACDQNDPQSVAAFYRASAEVLPWGHGIFPADHNVQGRRADWLRRVYLLKQIWKSGARTVLDYGAGGGHTSLLATAFGFDLVGHCEFECFNNFVRFRAEGIGQAQKFKTFDLDQPLKASSEFEAILCSDVAEHAADLDYLLNNLYQALRPGGVLLWVARFEDSCPGHLHFELAGKEEQLLRRHGFVRQADLDVHYEGHSGLFKKVERASQRPETRTVSSERLLLD